MHGWKAIAQFRKGIEESYTTIDDEVAKTDCDSSCLFGGRKVTYEVDNAALHEQLKKEWNDGNGTIPHYPKRSDWSTQVAENGPSLSTGGGLDVVVKRPFTFRLINVQYTHSWMQDTEMIHPQSGIRITTEAVLRIGTW